MIWRSLRVGGWIHAMEFDHESKGYKFLVTDSTGGYFERKIDIFPAYHSILGSYYVAIKVSMLLLESGL
jgi:mRNA degradation ribonuclease J1/J2